MTREEQKRRKRRRKRSTRVGIPGRILALLVVCVMPFLLFKTASASEQAAEIVIKAESAEILLGEALPQLTADVEATGDERTVLKQDEYYTVENLVQELEAGKGYTLSCQADTGTEGEYAIEAMLDEEIEQALGKEWIGRVLINIQSGTLKVKNPVGDWDGAQFKRYDGSYVVNDFVVSKGKTYYFGADQNKVAGLQEINAGRYYFDKDGVMQTGWQKVDGAAYYFNQQGVSVTGWLQLDADEYYLGEDGVMLTGEQQIGNLECVFAEDGKLTSKKIKGVDPSKPMVALTFDDGPGERTNELLDCLEQNNARATFFMLGQKVPSYSGVVARMKELNCELGNHSYDHANLANLDAGGIQSEIQQTNDNIAGAAGTPATVMRPPYGSINGTVRESTGMPLILWNIDTLDWKTRNAQSTINAVMGSVKDGDIILMHDIHTQSVDAAITLIPQLQAAGYQLVTVSEMAAAKGISMENGTTYTDF